jgi:hypothetical protein
MLMAAPVRIGPVVNVETLPEPDVVDVLPIDLNLFSQSNSTAVIQGSVQHDKRTKLHPFD